MKKIIINVVIVILLVSFSGCSEGYYDVNTPSGTTTSAQLGMSDLMGPVIYHTIQAQYNAERVLGNYSQQFTGRGGGAAGATSMAGTWSQIYLYVLPNLKTILTKAEENNATHIAAVAKILTAINIGLAADSWDNIPYSEASQGTENPKPAFDTQQSIYNEIDMLLSDAITLLEAPDTSGFSIGGDLIYDGDASNWLKAAYTLKARYQLHLVEQNGMAAATAALASLANGFTSNSDDFQMNYTTKNINPWYSREILAAATSNDHDKIGDQLVNYMNGTSYPYTTIAIDPRLPIYATNGGAITDPWLGYESGADGLSSNGSSANTNFADGGFYTNQEAPIVIISYAEAMFIKAEAEFIVNGGNETSVGTNNNAYTSYLEGITASMNKLGVSATDMNAYLTDTSIDMGVTNIMLQHIMKEKYIANFLNPEVFSDLRRYDFSTNVFKDLSLPVDNAIGEYPGQWLVRAQYPVSEETRNPENVLANKKEPTVKVWWDL